MNRILKTPVQRFAFLSLCVAFPLLALQLTFYWHHEHDNDIAKNLGFIPDYQSLASIEREKIESEKLIYYNIAWLVISLIIALCWSHVVAIKHWILTGEKPFSKELKHKPDIEEGSNTVANLEESVLFQPAEIRLQKTREIPQSWEETLSATLFAIPRMLIKMWLGQYSLGKSLGFFLLGRYLFGLVIITLFALPFWVTGTYDLSSMRPFSWAVVGILWIVALVGVWRSTNASLEAHYKLYRFYPMRLYLVRLLVGLWAIGELVTFAKGFGLLPNFRP